MKRGYLREIVLDTETTGLDPKDGHRVIEVGAVELIDKEITGKKFHCYLNPKRIVPEEAYRVHGISTHFLKDKPLFQSVVDDFLNFVADSRLVIHNAAFDVKFLNHEFSILEGKNKEKRFDLNTCVDTLTIARKKFPGQRCSLDALCKRYKIDLSARAFHGALKDAELLAKVYILLEDYMEQSKLLISKKSKKLQSDSNVKKKIKIIHPSDLELKIHEESFKGILY